MNKINRWRLDISEKPYRLFKIWRFTILFDRVVKDIFTSGYEEYKFFRGGLNNMVIMMHCSYVPKYIRNELDKIAEIYNHGDSK